MELEDKYALGIDVSHYKNLIDWQAVKDSGIKYAIMKSTEADDFIDERFDYNWTKTRALGIIRGAYHFFRPLVDPVAQARHFLAIAGATFHPQDIPPVLDVEIYPTFVREEFDKLSVSERKQRVRLWLETVEAELGVIPMIYTNYHTWSSYFGNSTGFSRYPLWVANYEVSAPRVPADNWDGKGWTFWQFTCTGTVPGISNGASNVDMNYYQGQFHELTAWLGITDPRNAPPDITNSEMMTALINAAEMLQADPNDWIVRTKMSYLIDPIGNSTRPYDGPAVEDLPLESFEKEALKIAIADLPQTDATAWGVRNQDIVNAIYYAASLEGIAGWGLVETAGLTWLVDDREALYTGPKLEYIDGLTEAQKQAVAEHLGIEYQASPPEEPPVEEPPEEEPPVEEPPAEEPQSTYPEITNQMVINAFYNAAVPFDLAGWAMVELAGLESLVEDRQALYTGPLLEALRGLTREQQEVLAFHLGVELGEAPPPLEPTYPGLTNQAMINAFYAAGENLNVQGWTLITRAGLTEMANFRPDEYSGPKVEDLPDLSEVEKISLAVELGFEINSHFGDSPYPGLVNQDMINLFYRAASNFRENGWDWITVVGLAYMAANREIRYQLYRGPEIENLIGLSAEKLNALQDQLALLEQTPV